MTALIFGPWAPDLPPVGVPDQNGMIPLQTAKNVLWKNGSYKPYLPLSTSGTALGSACLGAVACYDTSGNVQIFAGTATGLYKKNGTSWTDVSKAGGYTATHWSFQTFGDCLDASNGTDPMQTINITSGTNFADLDTSGTDLVPKPQVLGVVRDFLVAGNTTDATNGTVPFRLQWSALSADGQWPVPSTQDAYAKQSGAQTLYEEYGAVQYIGDGEAFGLVFQQSGIARMTYVGAEVVFQFDTFEKARGAIGPDAVAKVDNTFYFMSPAGFCATDGAQVHSLGSRKFDKWFFDTAKASTLSKTICVPDTVNKLIYIAFESTSGSNLDSLLIYNYEDGKATYCAQAQEWIFPILSGNSWTVGGFDTAHKYGTFSGTAGTATLTTFDAQLISGRRAQVNAVRPLAEGTATIALGTRDFLSSSASLSSYSAVNSLSGEANFLSDARYHDVSLKFTTSFTDCIGAEVTARPGAVI